jgi:hypothetical protein
VEIRNTAPKTVAGSRGAVCQACARGLFWLVVGIGSHARDGR